MVNFVPVFKNRNYQLISRTSLPGKMLENVNDSITDPRGGRKGGRVANPIWEAEFMPTQPNSLL